MKARLLFISLFLSVLLASCEKEPQVISVTGITVNPATLSLIEGETGDLVATVSPKDADNQTVTWESSDKSIATVSNGKVTAVKAGSTTVTVKSEDGGFTAKCAVTVIAKTVDVSSISLSKTELTLTEGDSETITATVKPDDATDKTVAWTSSDPAVATVKDGKIDALKEGVATITAKAGDKTATCEVTVEKKIIAVESVELDKTDLELEEGESATLKATVKPDDATDKTVVWTTSDASVASVEEGLVTALKEGSATITATSGEKSASCKVTVKRKVIFVESVELNKSELELVEGETETLVATVKPDNATDSSISWSSSDSTVAAVSASGEVLAVAAGTAVVTVTTTDGGKTASCSVTVKEKEKVDPLQSLYGDYTISSVFLAEDEGEVFYVYDSWEMSISPYEGSDSRIWIDKLTPFQSEDILGKYFPHGEVYAEVSEDLKTITIPVPQEVESKADAFEIDEHFVLYKSTGKDATAPFDTSAGVITFTLQADGSWKTTDSYGFSTKTYVSDGLFYYYLNCFGGYDPAKYPTVFVKDEDTAQQASAPSRMSARRVSTDKTFLRRSLSRQ